MGSLALPFVGGSNQYMSYPSMGGGSGGGSSTLATGSTPGMSWGPMTMTNPTQTYANPGHGTGVLGPSNPPQQQPGTMGAPGVASQYPQLPIATNGYPTTASTSGGFSLQGGAASVPNQDPNFSQEWGSMLTGQLGQGISPFDLSSYLPSSGQQTNPGQVAAPLTPILSQLQQFLSGGSSSGVGQQQLLSLLQSGGLTGNLGTTATSSGGLGASPTLSNLANTGGLTGSMGTLAATGDPIDQTPAWQAMVQSEAQNTALNQANLKEQFASMGDLSSSNAADAMSQYMQQVNLGQNAQLTQAQTQAQQQAVQNMLSAGTTGIGTQLAAGTTGLNATVGAGEFGSSLQSQLAQFMPQMSQSLGEFGQGLDQNAIQTLMSEYFQTSPQENPLLGMESTLATTYPSIYTKQGGVGGALAGGAGGLLSLAGQVGSSVGAGLSGGGGITDVLSSLGGLFAAM
jgi:hypothetical protein